MPSRPGPALVTGALILLGACGGTASDPEPPANDARWYFTDVTRDAGLGSFQHETGAEGELWIPESIGSGVAFTDYDRDEWVDLVLVAGGFLRDDRAIPALRVYRNQGDGTFVETTAEAGLSDLTAYGMGVYAADYDEDGDDDLFLTTLGRNVLLRNDGGTFRDVTASSGLGDSREWSTAAAFFDADRDGDLDLYVGNYVAWSVENDVFCSLDGVTKTYCTPKAYDGVPGRYYRNEGGGRFADRTDADGFGGAPGNTLGAVAFDYDRDGWTDLYVANDLRPNLLYRNDGDGTFTELAGASGAAYDERGYARAGMGVDAGVIDSTGRATIFVGNFSREPIGVFQYDGANQFMSRESATGLLHPSLPTLTFGLFLFDANLDGALDLFAVNGHVQPDVERADGGIRYRQPVHLFLNQGDGTFHDVAPDLGGALTEPLAGRGGAYADYDRDGDLDVLVVENGGRAHLWRNELLPARAGENGSVRVNLASGASNRSAIGARVVAYAGGTVLERQRRGGANYLSTSEKTLTFGLGGQRAVDSLVVDWPSGARTAYAGAPAGETLTLAEE